MPGRSTTVAIYAARALRLTNSNISIPDCASMPSGTVRSWSTVLRWHLRIIAPLPLSIGVEF
jgi:hypothetical protein